MMGFYLARSVDLDEWKDIRIFSGNIKPKKRIPWADLGTAVSTIARSLMRMIGYQFSYPHGYSKVVLYLQYAINDLADIANLITVGSDFQLAVLDRRVRFFDDHVRRQLIHDACAYYCDFNAIHVAIGTYVVTWLSIALNGRYEPNRLVKMVKEFSDLLKYLLYQTRENLDMAEDMARTNYRKKATRSSRVQPMKASS